MNSQSKKTLKKKNNYLVILLDPVILSFLIHHPEKHHMQPVTYIIIRSVIETESNKVITFVMAHDTALAALSKTKDWRSVWPKATITIERVMWLDSIKEFTTCTIEHSELLDKAKEELDKEIERNLA